jgi:hypothetical protein
MSKTTLKMTRLIIGLALLVDLATTSAYAQATSSECQWTDTWVPLSGGWSRYTNERFGTITEVPHHLFELKDPPPANGDGRALKAKDGAQLLVFASYSPSVATGTGSEDEKLLDGEREKSRRVTYKVKGKNWIVSSGTEGANIFYEKVVEGCGAAHTFSIVYPASKKALYDPVVTRVSRSLSCQNHPVRSNPFGLKSCPRQ